VSAFFSSLEVCWWAN